VGGYGKLELPPKILLRLALRGVILCDTLHSTVAYLQTDAYFAGLAVGEMNAGLFKGSLYLQHSGEVSFHDSFVLLDPLKRRQADPGCAGQLALAPAQQCPRRPNLRRISHRYVVFPILFWI
jgi:hypothetical protein